MPRAVATAMGKKARKPAISALVSQPVPSQITSAGAIATIGTVCAPITKGMMPRPVQRLSAISVPAAKPATVATASPVTASMNVTSSCRPMASHCVLPCESMSNR